MRRARGLVAAGEVGAGAALLRAAAVDAPEAERGELLLELAHVEWWHVRFSASVRTARRAVTASRRGPEETHAQALAVRALAVAVQGPGPRTTTDDVARALGEAEQAVRRLEAPSPRTLYLLAEAAMSAGALTVAGEAAEQAVQQPTGPPFEAALVRQVLARAYVFQGRLEEADREAAVFLEVCREHLLPGIESLGHSVVAFIAAQRGDRARLRSAVRVCLALATNPTTNYLHAGAHTLAGYALAADGQHALAAATVLAGAGPDLERMQFVDRAYGYELLAGAALAVGDAAAAQHWVERAQALPADGMAAAAVHRTEAMVRTAAGDQEGLGFAVRATADAAGAGGGLDAARARVLHGSALSRLGSRQLALAELEQVAADATALGALRIRSLAVRELRRLGHRVPPPGRGGKTLSPRERQVALLVADGLSNRQVSRLLGMSERTVQSHVVTILRRLGLPSRAGLPHALAGERVPSPASAPPPAMTGRQLAVAELVARGWSNARIAEELAVSPKTVEKHLGDAFQRCGVSSRTALAAHWTALHA